VFNTNKIEFPPKRDKEVFDKLEEWSAWYSGSSQRLLEFYQRKLPHTIGHVDNSKFWREYASEGEERIHIPLASDISKYSAGLLFSEPPNIYVKEANEENPSSVAVNTQERLRYITEKNNSYQIFVESAETASALGGAYLKINWDKEVADVPLLRVAQPDNAIPEFKYGFLTKVTFFRTVKEDASSTYRHFEIHSKGKIENKLFKGSTDYLGKEIDLSYLEETQGLLPEIEPGEDDLVVRYIPNDLPNRMWRDKHIGNSDYQGLEGLFDSLDEVYSSLMREIKLSKADKIVPESWLSYNEATSKLEYRDKMTYTGMNIPPDEMQKPELLQPKIRTDKYIQTILHLTDRIVDSAGYAPQSFGLNIKNRAESGTALRIRERKSLKTRSKKEKYFKKPIQDMMELLLKVDRVQFGTSMIDPNLEVKVTFADSIQEDPTEIAQSLRDIESAVAMSVEQKVKTLHPEWSDKEVAREVKKVKDEYNITTIGEEE